MSELHTMSLTEEEIACLGTDDNIIHGKTNLRRVVKSKLNVFTCMGYIFKVNNAYKRHVPFCGDTIEKYVENDKITKRPDGNGFFPTYACSAGTYDFFYGYNSHVHAEALQEELKDYIEVIWEDDHILNIKIKDPSKYLMELDFGCHNFGANINILTRI